MQGETGDSSLGETGGKTKEPSPRLLDFARLLYEGIKIRLMEIILYLCQPLFSFIHMGQEPLQLQNNALPNCTMLPR